MSGGRRSRGAAHIFLFGKDSAGQFIHTVHEPPGSPVTLAPPEPQMRTPAVRNRGSGQLVVYPPLGAEGHVHLIPPHQAEDDGAHAGIMPAPIKLYGVI